MTLPVVSSTKCVHFLLGWVSFVSKIIVPRPKYVKDVHLPLTFSDE